MDIEASEPRDGGRLKDIRAFIDSLYGHDLHAKRVDSLAAATLGVMTGASLAVAMIGQALAQARGLVTKHAIKQVDRLLSNSGIAVWDSFARWVPHLVGSRSDIVVAMDWTDFDGDSQATLALNLVTEHGRAMPLLWLSVWKDELKDQRNDIEDTCLRRLSEVVPSGCRVSILADRGFGDHKLFAYLADLGFAYVIRFRGNIHVTDASGETRTAAQWVGRSGRARKLRGARITASHAYPVGAVVCVHARDMKEPWCLAASDAEAPAGTLIKQYARRWTIEPSFRDTKDLRFGMGMAEIRIAEPERRDRLLLISAFAMVLLTMLGTAGEIRDRTYENQQHRACGLNLLVTAIILWNTRYLERAVIALRQIENVPSHLLAHLSPLGWEHVNLTGDYVWDVQQRASENPGGLRTLRAPPEVVRKAA